VVADRVGQIPEYVAPELHGLLCAPDDRDEMVEKCAELLCDGERRRRVSLTGRTFIMEAFSWRKYADLVHNFYVKCMATL